MPFHQSSADLYEISMIRPNLADLPRHALPEGFSLRLHRPGDDATWTRIHEQTERHHVVTPELYWEWFGEGREELPRRQYFLCNADGDEIGTATAWFNNDYHGLCWGRVHWVAIHDDYQGRGLGRGMLSALCQRFVELGHERAYVTTESVRVGAIQLYRSYGFLPEIKSDEDRCVWQWLKEQGVDVPG